MRYTSQMFAAPHPVDLQGIVTSIGNGIRGIYSTLAVMRRLVNQYKVNTDVLSAARSIVFLTPAKDEYSEVNAVFEYVRDCIRYTKDIYGVETISSPDKTMLTRVGDCDDKTTLLSTLLECVGYPTRFIVTGYNEPKNYEHVYMQVFCNGQWIDCDATEPYPIGYAPPEPVAMLIEDI